MTSKEERRVVKSGIGFIIIARALLIVFVIIAALFAMVQTAEAVTPTQMIIFTDKKVYPAWQFGGQQAAGNPPSATRVNLNPQDLRISVYAIVLDEDGKPIPGRTITAKVVDEKHLDHYNKNDNNVHHAVNTSIPSFFNIGPVSLTDNGGIYSTQVNLPEIDIAATANASLAADHIYVNVTVTDAILGTKNLTVLVSGLRCHNDYESGHGGTHFGDGSGQDNCGVCHAGNEHWYENISGTIPADQQDVHYKKIPYFDFYMVGKDFSDFRWNLSYRPDGTRANYSWSVYWPGSQYCAACHINNIGGTGYTYDYGGGDRLNLNDKPSCVLQVHIHLYQEVHLKQVAAGSVAVRHH
jgi:hypothetical protein